MKTQQIISKKTITKVLLSAVLLTVFACGGNKGNSVKEQKQSSDSQPPQETPSLDIQAASLMGDIETVQKHILAGTDLNQKEPAGGSTPLITATVFDKTEVAKALIEAGADVNIKNNDGSTALHTAAFLCRLEIVEMLLENGADKDIMNNFGSTALESVLAPFENVKAIYDQFSKDLGPLGLKLDYEYIELTRPKIAEILQ